MAAERSEGVRSIGNPPDVLVEADDTALSAVLSIVLIEDAV